MSRRSCLLLLGALVTSACSHKPPLTPQARFESTLEDARGELRSIITDKDRAAQAEALLLRLKEVVDQADANSTAMRARIDDLDRRHDATAEQFQATLAAADAAWATSRRIQVDIRDQLARLLTAEEWQKSATARKRLLESQLGPQPL
jgi:hypothetical protein